MKIILYTKKNCPWCRGVLDLFSEKKVAFEERDVTDNKANFDEMVKKSGQTLAPTLDIDGFILADSDRVQVEQYLKDNG